MFFKEEKYSPFNSAYFRPSENGGLLHVFANNQKVILVLEHDVDGTNQYQASEMNIRHQPLTYQSDFLKTPTMKNNLLEILNLIKGLECRLSNGLSPEQSKAIASALQNAKSMTNPSREEYLGALFEPHKNVLPDNLIDSVIAAASRSASSGCVIL